MESVLEAMYSVDSSSCSSSSEEDDLDLILLDLVSKPKRILGPRVHLDDLSDMECERLFRLVDCIFCIASLCQCRNCTSCFL